MSLLRGQLVAEVYEYCGDPPDRPLKEGGLPKQFVFQVLVENEDELLRDLELSDQGRRIAKQEITLSQNEREFSLNSDAAAPSYVTLQTDPNNNIVWPVEIVAPNALLQSSWDGIPAISFRDTPPTAEVSWQPDINQVLTVWYERSGNDAPQLAASTDLGNLYDSYLKLRTAAQCREVMGLPIGSVLETRLLRSDRQWQKYAQKGSQKGLGYKSRLFGRPRLNRTLPFLNRTRFFIP